MSTDDESVLGRRVQGLRERLGYSQDDLAGMVGFASRQTLSDLERGKRAVKASELVRLARALRVDVATLLAANEKTQPRVLWREKPESGAEILQADFLAWSERYAHVKRVTETSDGEWFSWPAATLRIRDASYDDVEELARQVGAQMELGARPASSLQRSLETRLGVMIWFLDLGEDGSAACARGEFGSSILVNRREAPWRQNFDMGHELFHLLTWDTTCGEIEQDPAVAIRAEKLANAFAAALLLPGEHVSAELNRCARKGSLELNDLVALARDFDVSTSALLWRLRTLGCGIDRDQIERLLGDPRFKRLDRAARTGTWGQCSPLPERFVWLAALACSRGRLSRTKLAEYLGCGLADLDACLSEYGIAESELGPAIEYSRAEDDLDVAGGENAQAAVCLT